MKKLLIINDLHLGVQRTGGTTLSSAAALREYAHQQHRRLLNLAEDGIDVLVNGDLSDSFNIPLGEALNIYVVAAGFLESHPNSSLCWALGNHDLSKNSANLGTVAFMGALLQARFPERFRLIDSPEMLRDGIYVLPHVANQDLLELELTRVPEGVKFLLLHLNYDNTFAMAADHSLNLSRAQAKELKAKGITMILGHEHQQKEALGGSVIVVGNQFPTSVSDCLNNDKKRCAVIDGDGVTFIQTWSRVDDDAWFAEVDWRELATVEEEGRGFIRVTGKASTDESAAAIKAISAFRQRSQSFVITNAVQVEQAEGVEDLAASVEDIRSVDVMQLLLDLLDPEQRAAILKLTNQEAA